MQAMMKSLGIEQLSVDDRLLLLEEIWESVSADSDRIPVTDAQKQDLQRRLDAHKENPKAGKPWEEVKARLRGKP